MNWQLIEQFAHTHQEGIGLFLLAMAVTMRPKLPWPFVLLEPLEWAYEWVRDGILTFVSMRGPAHSEASANKNVERTTETDPATGKKTESVKESISGTAVETPAGPPQSL